jgi:hypothetical protein
MKKQLESDLAKVYNSLPDFLKNSMGSYIKNYEIISDPFVDSEEHQQKGNKKNARELLKKQMYST